MRVASINLSDYGSTGNIMAEISELIRENGGEAYTACPDGLPVRKNLTNHFYIGTPLERRIHWRLALMNGRAGCYSHRGTAKLLKQLDKIHPDVLHLHNLHHAYINIPMLFRYIKKNKIKVVWTLHDCWAFTGHCTCFMMADCDKWKTGCENCTQYREYPQSNIDNSKMMYRLKKKWFCGVEDMTIVTPSEWLAGLVKQSYLKEYPIKVIHNGIDLEVFKPTESDFRTKYSCENKKIVLGVALCWERRKGIDVFIELAKRLPEDYQIVLVGTDDEIDKQLPDNIISVHSTQNQTELAKIYTTADVFANPTREETLGLVNLEALACGTPVVTFNTGGSPECIDESCGIVVERGDVNGLEKEIYRVCEERPFSEKECRSRAEKFDKNMKFMEYIRIYKW